MDAAPRSRNHATVPGPPQLEPDPGNTRVAATAQGRSSFPKQTPRPPPNISAAHFVHAIATLSPSTEFPGPSPAPLQPPLLLLLSANPDLWPWGGDEQGQRLALPFVIQSPSIRSSISCPVFSRQAPGADLFSPAPGSTPFSRPGLLRVDWSNSNHRRCRTCGSSGGRAHGFSCLIHSLLVWLCGVFQAHTRTKHLLSLLLPS